MSLAQAIIARLSEFDFVIAIDTSGSMAEPVKAGSSRTRWGSGTRKRNDADP